MLNVVVFFQFVFENVSLRRIEVEFWHEALVCRDYPPQEIDLHLWKTNVKSQFTEEGL